MNRAALIVAAGSRLCAIPLEHVEETMRPLPIEPFAGAAGFVVGVSVLRGAPAPVVDLAALLGSSGPTGPSEQSGQVLQPTGRMVSLRLGARRVVLAVDVVRGIRNLDEEQLAALPPLLGQVGRAIESLGILDHQLLLALRSARLVSEETWALLDAARPS